MEISSIVVLAGFIVACFLTSLTGGLPSGQLVRAFGRILARRAGEEGVAIRAAGLHGALFHRRDPGVRRNPTPEPCRGIRVCAQDVRLWPGMCCKTRLLLAAVVGLWVLSHGFVPPATRVSGTDA